MQSVAGNYFIHLSRDLLYLLRSFLVSFQFHPLDSISEKEIHEEEGRRSWNDFLAASKDEEWQRMRKESLVICLGLSRSKSYIEDEHFRKTIQDKVCDYSHQLSLHTSTFENHKSLGRLQYLHLYRINCIEIPPISDVINVEIRYCMWLRSVSCLEGVKSLSVETCTSLRKIECTCIESLSVLSCRWHEVHINVEKLKFLECSMALLEYFGIEKLISLQKLIINSCPEIPTPLVLPSGIQSFSSAFLPVMDFRNYPKLQSLKITNMIDQQIVEMKQLIQKNLHLCSELRKLVFHGIALSKDILLTHFPMVKDVDFSYGEMEDSTLVLTDRIRSITLVNSNVKYIENLSPEKRYFEINLMNCSALDQSIVPLIRNTTWVNLSNNPWVTDISALADVPYLSLFNCNSIEDFSPLGRQRCLDLGLSSKLQNSDLERLSKVHYLNIDWCSQISDISMLRENLVILASYLPLLAEANLLGRDYRRVRLISEQLMQVNISGKVHQLTVHPHLTTVVNPENCEIIERTEN